MHVLRLLAIAGLVATAGCAWGGAPTSSQAPQTAPATMTTSLAASPTATASPPATPEASAAASVIPATSPGFPLAEAGPYAVGVRTLPAITDPARGERAVSIRVWYPALQPSVPTDSPGFVADAPPDPSGGPYPAILSSSKVATIFAPYVVSHGFGWVSVDGLDSYPQMSRQMIDQPLDILFALDQVASAMPEGLEGMLDTGHSGVIGYSFDGYNALAMSGARIDSAYYLSNCPTPDAATEPFVVSLSAFDCAAALEWDEYARLAGDTVAPGEDGLWHPLSDDRIRAAMPMAAEGWWLFGERGLAAVDRPVLMLAATGDPLYAENAAIYEHLGTADTTFISFLGPDHMMVYDPVMVGRMAHFAIAFFGYHLAGRQDMAPQFAESFVAGHPDLAWGTVPSP
jgi:hypothetical protein